MALLGSQIRWEFSPSDREAVQPCVLSSYLIIPNPRTNRCSIKAQLLSSLFTKFIVMGPLGLDLIHLWTQSENSDPTKVFLNFNFFFFILCFPYFILYFYPYFLLLFFPIFFLLHTRTLTFFFSVSFFPLFPYHFLHTRCP